jgi:NhaC family Na+:H+ antiporter
VTAENAISTGTAMTLLEAVAPVLTMVGLFAGAMLLFEPSGEVLVVILLVAAAVAGGVAHRHGVGWAEVQATTGQRIASVLPGLLILLAIGMLIATWILSGTVPWLVYHGIQIVNPRYLLLTAFLTTAVMSLVTGTSWGSAGTMGVALMGMAAALDVSLAATAGAVVSGAYFGDKLSPLSDSTNCCAIGAGADLYAHIRHMGWTAGPSFVLAVLVYGLAASSGGADGLAPQAQILLDDLDRVFNLNPVVLLPAAIVGWGIARKTAPALALALSSLVAAVLGVVLQGFGVIDAVRAAVAGFRPELLASAGVDPASVGTGFVTLVQRGGLYSMANTLVIVISALLLAGAMQASGAMDLLLQRMLASVRSVFGLIGATMAAGGTMIAMTSHGLVTALVIGELFQGAYDERGMARVNLSRSLEDSVTVTEPIMPWTVSAVFMATTLGVATIDYLPWAVFCYGGPFFSLLWAAAYRHTGLGLKRAEIGAP